MLKKLGYINLLSITVLALFNYIVFHNMNSKAYLESFTAYNEKIVNIAFQNIDKQIISAVTDIPLVYFSPLRQNSDIMAPQSEQIIDKPEQVISLVSRLSGMQDIYPYVKSLDIYYEGTQSAITGFMNYHTLNNDGEIERYMPWLKEYQALDEYSAFLEWPNIIYPTGAETVTFVSRLHGLQQNEHGMIVAVHIDPKSFGEYIDEQEGNLILSTPSGKVVYRSKNTDAETVEIIVEKSKEAQTDGKLTCFQTTAENEKMMVFSQKSSNSQLQYTYYIKDSNFYADYNVKNRIFFFNFVLSIIFNLLILGMFSLFNHIVYKKQILKVSEEAGIELEDKKGSFDHSLKMLSNEITTLNENVKSSTPYLFQNAVRFLLLNKNTNSTYERLDKCLKGQYVSTAIICSKQYNLNDTTVQLQEQFLHKEEYQVLFTTMEKGEMIAVLVYDQGQEENVRNDFCNYIMDEIKDCTLTIGMSFPREKENIKKSYESATTVFLYRFIFTDAKVLTYKEVNAQARKNSGSHLKMFEAMERDINGGDLNGLRCRIEGLLFSFKEGNYTIEYCRSTLRDLVTMLYRIVVYNQMDVQIVFGYDIREYYKFIEDIDQFKDWILEICEVFFYNIQQQRKTVDADMQTQLTRLIDDNLENDITLEYLADYFDMRPDALSRVFKKTMGKNYTEYIKEKKIDRAMELLKQDCSVKDIAAKLGYSSPQYFIKIFKEMYGLTPYQYKKKNMEPEE